MGKTNKFNDRDHAAIADGTSLPHDHLPRFFAKSGYVDINPNKMKKNGAGKGGWSVVYLFLPRSIWLYHLRTNLHSRGVDGEEVQDEPFSMLNARRRSNSSSYTAGLKDFKTKFETVEQDPVFEEDMGPLDDDDLSEAHRTNTDSSDGSIDENDKTKRD